jgi:hypothetical protein
MDDVRTRPGLLRLGLMRLLDGDRPWGSLDIRADRFGVTRYRLVVYPPGTSQSERRWVRAARGWPLWGALVWVIAEIWLSQVTGPWTALTISTAAFLGLGVITMAMAGDARTRVRTMAAMVMVGQPDPAAAATRDRLEALSEFLMEADARFVRRQISPAEHEMTWWLVYDQMEPGQPISTRVHWLGRETR